MCVCGVCDSAQAGATEVVKVDYGVNECHAFRLDVTLSALSALSPLSLSLRRTKIFWRFGGRVSYGDLQLSWCDTHCYYGK